MAWDIEFDPDAVKDLKKLDKQVQVRILGFLRSRLAAMENPRELGEALAGSQLGNYRKYRVGDWRLICDPGSPYRGACTAWGKLPRGLPLGPTHM